MKNIVTILVVFFVLVPMGSVASWNPLPDTGQKTCFDVVGNEIACPVKGEILHGQDAQYAGLEKSFSANSQGIITDHNTKLAWYLGGEQNWQNALQYCNDLNTGEYSEWRLPDKFELESIIDHGRYDPAISSLFSCSSPAGAYDGYWAKTSYAWDDGYAWLVHCGDGFVLKAGKLYSHDVICIHGEQSFLGVYTDNHDDTITDQTTNLHWQQQTSDTDDSGFITGNDMVNWQEALAWCEGSNFAGHSDWRLPNVLELESLVDPTRFNPSIASVFSSQPSFYWSSTTASNNTEINTLAWTVGFSIGNASTNPGTKTNINYVRCVRGGLAPPPGPFQLMVKQSGSGGGRLISDIGDIDCTADSCTQSYAKGTTISLSAYESHESIFTGWVNCPDPEGNVCNVTMNQDQQVTARFDLLRMDSAHFEFSEISGSKNVGEPFSVTLSLVDDADAPVSAAKLQRLVYGVKATETEGNTFTQNKIFKSNNSPGKIKVDISSTCGPVSPSRLEYDFTAGFVPIDTIVLQKSANCQLTAQYGRVAGRSNNFSSVSGSWDEATSVVGKVKWNHSSAPVVGAKMELFCTVFLSNGGEYGKYLATHSDGTPIITSSDGSYSIDTQWIENQDTTARYVTNQKCYLWATLGTRQSLRKKIFISTGLNKAPDLLFFEKKQPVLLVPGLMGTDGTWNPNIVPELPKESAPDQDELTVHLQGVLGWKALKKSLEDTGKFSVFYVPWDWRLDPRSKEAIKYLKDKIHAAKLATGFNKVDVIAHSLGGLLVRSYVQSASLDYSSHYNNDIDRFAMVGTPNHGSAFAYPMWEGGEPIIADNIKGDVGIININSIVNKDFIKYFYSQAVNKAYRNQSGTDLIVFEETICTKYAYHTYSSNCFPRYIAPFMKKTKSESRDFIHKHIPSLKALMPTWQNPLQFSVGKTFSTENQNDLLGTLNGTSQLQNLANLVNTKVFASSQLSTTKTIYVTGPGKGVYPDGVPWPCFKKGVQATCYEKAYGDGTVPYASASLHPYIPIDVHTIKGEHADLIKTFKDELVNFLQVGRLDASQSKPLSKNIEKNYNKVTASSLLTFTIKGDRTFVITDPFMNKTGINLISKSDYEEISNTEFMRLGNGSGISITNPLAGKYEVDVTGTLPDRTVVTVNYFSSENNKSFEIPFFNKKSTVSAFTIILDKTELPTISLNSSIVPPGEFAAVKGTTGALLKWTQPASGKPAFYRIYHRSEYEPLFTLLGMVSGDSTTYGTVHEFDGAVRHLYTIAAVNSTNEESFLSPIVSNQKETIIKYKYPTFPWTMFIPAITGAGNK